jgi:large subunit ribosomal protein L25
METVKLVAQKRLETGKGQARRLRKAGKLPAVVYGRGDTEVLTVDARELLLIRQSGGENTFIDLEIGGDTPEMCSVILREVQVDPASRVQVHADFYRLAMDELITVTVPVEFVNIPEDRLKAAQSEVSVLARELTVECLPREIPNTIEVDLEELQVGDVLHAGATALPRGVTLLTNAEEAVVTTSMITVVEEGAEPEGKEALAGVAEGAPEATGAANEAEDDG